MNKALVLSWLKVFLSAVLSYVLASLLAGTTIAWQAVLIAGAVSVLPTIINWLDTSDTRYGRGSE
jgi:hypothetical protein